MNASEKGQCKRCGAVVPAKSAEQLCPACLMSGALEPTGSTAFVLNHKKGLGEDIRSRSRRGSAEERKRRRGENHTTSTLHVAKNETR